jgi:PII-like signaling protein
MTMRHQGLAKRLMVFIGESDQHRHKPLYAEIVHRAHAAGLAGASVLRGVEGFGASQQVHTTRLLSLTEDLPIVIVLVDDADRIERFALELDELITEGLVVIDDVEVVRYVGRQTRRGRGESP